jgi:hypothetical protein
MSTAKFEKEKEEQKKTIKLTNEILAKVKELTEHELSISQGKGTFACGYSPLSNIGSAHYVGFMERMEEKNAMAKKNLYHSDEIYQLNKLGKFMCWLLCAHDK